MNLTFLISISNVIIFFRLQKNTDTDTDLCKFALDINHPGHKKPCWSEIRLAKTRLIAQQKKLNYSVNMLKILWSSVHLPNLNIEHLQAVFSLKKTNISLKYIRCVCVIFKWFDHLLSRHCTASARWKSLILFPKR